VVAKSLTIATCLWGEFPDPGWGERYVERLKNAVARNLSVDHRFVCFSDRSLAISGVECRSLNPPSWKGHLPKLYVYSPEAGLTGRVILFDLDNLIVGSLDDMAAYSGPLCVRGRLTPAYNRLPDGDMISFDAGAVGHLWEAANRKDIEDITLGRERVFIHYVAPHCDQWQLICPGQVVSYRYCAIKKLPPEARVVSFHGRPRIHEVSHPWVDANWQ
jgi:hypothetical protein